MVERPETGLYSLLHSQRIETTPGVPNSCININEPLYSLLHSQRIETQGVLWRLFDLFVWYFIAYCIRRGLKLTFVCFFQSLKCVYHFIAYCIRRGLKHRPLQDSVLCHWILYSLLHSQRIETPSTKNTNEIVSSFIAYCIRRGLKPTTL